MMRWTTTLSISSLLALGGCFTDLFAQGDALVPDGSTETGSMPTTESSIPTTSVDSDVHTVTGVPDSETAPTTSLGSNSSDTADDPPPSITIFEVTPELVEQIGFVQVHLLASDDVIAADLELDGDPLKHFETNKFLLNYEFLPEEPAKPVRTFKVVVRDAAQQTATAERTIAVVLPSAGEQKCIFEDPDRGKLDSSISAVRYTKTAIVAVGTREVDAELKLTIWLLHPDTCQLLPGWPQSISGWSKLTDFIEGRSIGTAVDIDPDSNLVVAGNRIEGTSLQSYVALLDMNGTLKWEKPGLLGDEVNGVAAGNKQFKDRTFVVGSRRTNDIPPRTDGMIWIYQATGDQVLVPTSITLQAPFAPDEIFADPQNLRSEWVRAVVLNPVTGSALVVGEREFKSNQAQTFSRTFTAIVQPNGLVGAPWTSPGDSGFVHDAARSVAACGDGYVAGGWARDEPVDAKPRPITFWLGLDGSAIQQRAELQLTSAQTNGIACDRQHHVVSAGTRSDGESDAQVFMVTDPFEPRVGYETGVPADDGAGAVACDPRGFCAWAGFRTLEGKPYAVVRAHHP
jgi:hypothetical protein